MAKFKLKSQSFSTPEKKYVQGDFITSDKPLDKIFKNTFSKVNSRRSEPAPDEEEEEEESTSKFQIVPSAEEEGRYDVVKTGTDEKINDKTLTEKQAIKLAGKDAPILEAPETEDEEESEEEEED